MNDTASEHYMVERFILDDLKSWAVNYKVIVRCTHGLKQEKGIRNALFFA